MMKKIILKGLRCVNALALLAVIQSVNSTCVFYYHQPSMPERALKYKR